MTYDTDFSRIHNIGYTGGTVNYLMKEASHYVEHDKELAELRALKDCYPINKIKGWSKYGKEKMIKIVLEIEAGTFKLDL